MSFSHLSGSSVSNTNGLNLIGKRTCEPSVENTSRAGLVQFLEEELKIECEQTDRQRRLYSTLLREYEITRQQLAEARLHIDRLRFGAHVNVHKHYIITHSLVPRDSSLLQRIAEVLRRRNPDLAPLSTLSPGDSSSDSEDRTNLTAQLPDYLVAEMESQISPEVARRVQSIYSLQQQVATLEGGIKNDNASFEELRKRLKYVQEQHRDLSSGVTDMLSNSDQEVGEEVRGVLQEELLKLSQQLQNLNQALKKKAQQILSLSPLANNGNAKDQEGKAKSNTLSELSSRYLENRSQLSTSMESLLDVPGSAECLSQLLLHEEEFSDGPTYPSISFPGEQLAVKGKGKEKKDSHQKMQGHRAHLPPRIVKESDVMEDDDHQTPQQPSRPQGCRNDRGSPQTTHKDKQRHDSPHTLTDSERAKLLAEESRDKVKEYLERHQASSEWHVPLEMDSGYMESPLYGSTNSSPRPPLNAPNIMGLNKERRMDRGRSTDMEREDYEWEKVPRRLTTGEKAQKEEHMKDYNHLQRKKESRLKVQQQVKEREEETEKPGQLEQERTRKIDYGQRQSNWEREREMEEWRKMEKERKKGMKNPKLQMRERESDTNRASDRARGRRAKHKDGGVLRERIVDDDIKSTSSTSSIASKTITQESSTREALESLKQEFLVLSEQLQDMQQKQPLVPLPKHQVSRHSHSAHHHLHQMDPFQPRHQEASIPTSDQLNHSLDQLHSPQPHDQLHPFPLADPSCPAPKVHQSYPPQLVDQPYPSYLVDQPHPHHPVDQPHPHHPVAQPYPHHPADQPHPHQPVDQPHPHHPVAQPYPHHPADQPHPHHPVDQSQPHHPVDRSQPHHSVDHPHQSRPFQSIHQPQYNHQPQDTHQPDTHIPPAHEQQMFTHTGEVHPPCQKQLFLLPSHNQLQASCQDQHQQLPVQHPSLEQPFQQDVDQEQAAHYQQPTFPEKQHQPAIQQVHQWQPPNHTLPVDKLLQSVYDGQLGHQAQHPLQGQAFLPIHQPSSTILKLPQPSDQTLGINGQKLHKPDTSVPHSAANSHNSDSLPHAPTLQDSSSLPLTSLPKYSSSLSPIIHSYHSNGHSAAPLTRSLPITVNHASSSTPHQEGEQTEIFKHQQLYQCQASDQPSDQPRENCAFPTKGPALSDSPGGLVLPHQQEDKQPKRFHQQHCSLLNPQSYWTSSEPPTLRVERTKTGMTATRSDPVQPHLRPFPQLYNPPVENLEHQTAFSCQAIPPQGNEYRREHIQRNPSASCLTVPEKLPQAQRRWCPIKTSCRHCRHHTSTLVANRETANCHPQPNSQQNGNNSLVSLPTSVSSHQPRLAQKLDQHFSSETTDGSSCAQETRQRLVCTSPPSVQMATGYAQHSQPPCPSHHVDIRQRSRGERRRISLLRCHDNNSGSSDDLTELGPKATTPHSGKQTHPADAVPSQHRCHIATAHHQYQGSPQATISETRQQRPRRRRRHASDPTTFLFPGTTTLPVANFSQTPRLREIPMAFGSDCNEEVFVTSLDEAECLAHKLRQASLRLNRSLRAQIATVT